MELDSMHEKEPHSKFGGALPLRWRISLPFIAGMLVFVFIVWTIIKLVAYPHDGIGNLHPTGLITAVEPSGPSHNKLFDGDRIILVDEVPWGEVVTAYSGKRGGDQVQFWVDRAGEYVPVTITLIDPPLSEIFLRLVPIIVALVFLGIGVGVQTFKPMDGIALLFFLWCSTSAATLTAGVASYLGPVWTSAFFNSLLWFIGPLSVHFHSYFPQAEAVKRRRWGQAVLYFVAAVGMLPNLLTVGTGVYSINLFPFLPSLSRLFLGVNLLLVVGLLYYNYKYAASPGARGKIRLVVLGGGLSGLSIVTLTLLPDALFHQPILPYQYSFLLLVIFPLTYGFAIYRFHLIEIDRHVNRGATYFLIYSVLGGAYLTLYAIMNRILPEGLEALPLVNTILVLFLVYLFFPLRLWVQRLVDTVFYGSWYDYRIGVMQITQGLEQYPDLNSLAKSVSERLVNTLNLEESCAFLRDPNGSFSVIEVALRANLAEQQRDYPVLPRSSLTFLLKIGAVEKVNLRKTLSDVTVTPEELQLLTSEQIHLWVPVVGHDQIMGLLALGPKLGGDVFSGEDLDILRVLARQLGPLIENLHLLTRLRQHAAELEQRVEERTEELHSSKERVEAILTSVGDGVIVTDLDGKIIRVNPAFEQQSGYFAGEIVGKQLDVFLAEPKEPALFSVIKPSLYQEGLWSGELTNRRKSGELYSVQLTIAPVRDQSGAIVSYVGSQIDITRQKELERMKDVFVADVSHELRTPTTNINLYLDLLENAPAEKQQRYIETIRNQSKQLVKLVEDILDLSRLARGETTPSEFTDIDLNLLVEQVIHSLQRLVDASGIHLESQFDSALPQVRGDPQQIVRMVTNLLTNAVRYTVEGSVTVSTQKSEAHVALKVVDTGIGIDDSDLGHIFERFYRGKNVRQSNINGTGLGLAIVKEIVNLHEGEIEVQSEPGKGSTFTVRLPVAYMMHQGIEPG